MTRQSTPPAARWHAAAHNGRARRPLLAGLKACMLKPGCTLANFLASTRLCRPPAAPAARGVEDHLPAGVDQHLLQPPAGGRAAEGTGLRRRRDLRRGAGRPPRGRAEAGSRARHPLRAAAAQQLQACNIPSHARASPSSGPRCLSWRKLLLSSLLSQFVGDRLLPAQRWRQPHQVLARDLAAVAVQQHQCGTRHATALLPASQT